MSISREKCVWASGSGSARGRHGNGGHNVQRLAINGQPPLRASQLIQAASTDTDALVVENFRDMVILEPAGGCGRPCTERGLHPSFASTRNVMVKKRVESSVRQAAFVRQPSRTARARGRRCICRDAVRAPGSMTRGDSEVSQGTSGRRWGSVVGHESASFSRSDEIYERRLPVQHETQAPPGSVSNGIVSTSISSSTFSFNE